MALLNCNATYDIDVPGCAETITVLAPKKNVLYSLKWHFANGFTLTHKLTSNNSTSLLTITKDAALLGFWNDGTGSVILELFEGATCEPATLTFCTIQYSQVTINFKPIQSDDTTFAIPCNC